jgi:uncharacterized protein (TIGR02996 family)
MAVHFVYRCHYGNPSEKHVRHFEADSVLDWFRSIWTPIPEADGDRAYDHAYELVGTNVYSFLRLFHRIAEHGWAPPKSMRALASRLEEALYVNEMKSGPHHVQVYTDDDDLEMVIYIFDDHYVAANPGRAAFLLHDGWKLPDGTGPGGFRTREPTRLLSRDRKGTGTTYLAILAFYASDNIDALQGARRVDGVRLPDLPRHLLGVDVSGDEWPREMPDLRRKLLRAPKGAADERGFLTRIAKQPDDETTWGAFSDWLRDRGNLPAGPYLLERAFRAAPPGLTRDNRRKKEDLIHVGEHLAQACKHVGTGFRRQKEYHQWIFFDDRWASAHPELANGILRFAARWDVL